MNIQKLKDVYFSHPSNEKRCFCCAKDVEYQPTKTVLTTADSEQYDCQVDVCWDCYVSECVQHPDCSDEMWVNGSYDIWAEVELEK